MREDARAERLAVAEYQALRATIAARGNLRPVMFLGGLVAWAATFLVVLAWFPQPLLALVPLTVLVGTFEVLRGLHFGVERIGRYLQVFFEEGLGPSHGGGIGTGQEVPSARLRPPAWERAVVRVGGRLPGAAGHPLFVPLFALMTLVNLLAVLLPGPLLAEWAPVGLLHAAFAGWMLYVDRGVRAQRTHDEARFKEMRDA